MEYVEIHGGRPLSGRVEIQGSKNAVLPMLAGCLLHTGISRIEHCPKIRDVFDMITLLENLGCSVWWEERCLAVDASRVSGWQIPQELASRMRSSVLFLGALLGRMGKARIPYPGGCVLGTRPVDLHVKAMKELGADIFETETDMLAVCGRLKGTEISLRFPSVGATENIILASVLAEGRTVIHNAAREPEIEELCLFLQEKGARISRYPEGEIEITGVAGLRDSRHVLAADRIVAGTYALAAAVTRGNVTIERMPVEHMVYVMGLLEKMGIIIERTDTDVRVDCRGTLRGELELDTAPYPGFPTDLQSPMMTLLAVTEGSSRIRENIFEARFKTAGQLCAMGAQIRVCGREALIHGVEQLHGAEVEAEELRGAAALVLAGLNASGITRIRGCRYISRGYENICRDLTGLGAQIRYV